jgi:hypothetical protein
MDKRRSCGVAHTELISEPIHEMVQQSKVGVCTQDGQLLIHDLCAEKGQMIKYKHHYRNHTQRISDLEMAITEQLPASLSETLCQLLKRTSPGIYKDQLVAARDLLREHAIQDQIYTPPHTDSPADCDGQPLGQPVGPGGR